MNENSLKNLKKGNTKNVGRKNGGRAEVIRLLDDLLIEKKEDINQYFKQEFENDIGKFLKTWVYHLLPKDVNLNFENPLETKNTDKFDKIIDSMTEKDKKKMFEIIERNNGID